MKTLHARRLLKLADFLDTVKAKNFNIDEICSQQDECGTVACAAGWAGTIPAFRRAGLKLGAGTLSLNGISIFSCCIQNFFGYEAYDASIWFSFGYLSDRVTPQMVSRKIRKLVKEYRPELTGTKNTKKKKR